MGADWRQQQELEEREIMETELQIKSTKGLHENRVKLLVYGKSGAGKTHFLGTGDNQRTIIVSAESGLLTLKDKEIDVIEVSNFDQAREAYRFASECGDKYDTVCIDSLTEISDMLVCKLEKLPEYKDPKNTLKLWGEYNKRMTALVKAFRALPKNVVFTALEEDVNDGGTLIKKPFIKGNATQKMLESYFDEVFYMYIDPATEQRTVMTQPTTYISAKDRSGSLVCNEEPNLTNIINKIKGV